MKLGEQKGRLLWRAQEREPITGVWVQSPQPGCRGRSPPEADSILVPSTHFCAVLELVVVADLTEATRQRRTFDTAAILSVND